jgi:hypothetical protein
MYLYAIPLVNIKSGLSARNLFISNEPITFFVSVLADTFELRLLLGSTEFDGAVNNPLSAVLYISPSTM